LVREEEGDDQADRRSSDFMARARADYTLSFRNLTGQVEDLAGFVRGTKTISRTGWCAYRERTKAKAWRAWTRSILRFVCALGGGKPPIRAVEDNNDIRHLDRIFGFTVAV
jgi:hypothetical protein